jgi:AAA domain
MNNGQLLTILDSRAVQRARLGLDGGRNNTGLWLACQLRDNKFSQQEAETAMRQYAAAVGNGGDQSYTESEAIRTVRSCYGRPPREPWSDSTSHENSNGKPSNGASIKPFQFFDDEEIQLIKRPPFLLDGIIPQNSFSVAFGQPGDGKSFFALALALSHATGQSLLNHDVVIGTPAYIAAEGSAGLGIRIASWKAFHNKPGKAGVCFLTEPIQFMQPSEVDRFLLTAENMPKPPSLIVIDTMARCLIGGDENSSKDVGLFIAGCDKVRTALGAAVLIVHHTTKDGAIERGSSALRGAADVMLQFSRDGELIIITCAKMKDAEPFKPLCLSLTKVGVGNESSCVLEVADLSAKGCNDRLALKVLTDNFSATEGATSSEWLALCEEAGMKRRSFFYSLKSLVEAELVRPERRRYFPA